MRTLESAGLNPDPRGAKAMRTTLDIDDDILQAAKELARAEKKTAGQVISELARRGLTQGAVSGFGEEAQSGFLIEDGWVQLPRRAGAVVTKDVVDRLIEEADDEEARRKGGY
jgi:hypothetical protein